MSEVRAAFIEAADAIMAEAELAPIYEEDNQGPDALARLYYRPSTFKADVAEHGTYGAVAVVAGGRELSLATDVKALAKERARLAILKYRAGEAEMERGE